MYNFTFKLSLSFLVKYEGTCAKNVYSKFSYSLKMQATTPEYRAYQEQVLSNCSKFAEVWL